MKQKDEVGRSRLHLRLQTSMTSVQSSSSNADNTSSAAVCTDANPVDDLLDADFEKLSLTSHQTFTKRWSNDGCLAPAGKPHEDAPPWFLQQMKKMEENLRQIIHEEVHQCVQDAFKEHFSESPVSRPDCAILEDESALPDPVVIVRPKKPLVTDEPLHLGITCDHCEQSVSGIRFKCGNCVDYDLCEACERIPGVHQADHVFLKIRRPTNLLTYRQKGERRKSLLRHLYPQAIQGPSNEGFRCRKREKKVKRWLNHAENFFAGSGYLYNDKCGRLGFLSGGRTSANLLGNVQTQSLHERHKAQTQNSFQGVSMCCLTEVSPASPLVVQPGQEFKKEWKIRNDSQEQFSASFRLRFSWGSLVPQGQVEVSIPALRPGETGVVGPVHFRAPQQEGLYHSHWLMVSHPGGKPFQFPYLSCPVHVKRKEVLQEETKDSDTVSSPVLTKLSEDLKSADTLNIVHVTESEVKVQNSPASNTTDPEETDDTASILSISSCESDDDYVKVQDPAQLVFSTNTLLNKRQVATQSAGHLESQATSSSSIDLLSDMPQLDEENCQRKTLSLGGDVATSSAPSTVALENSLHNSPTRSSIHSSSAAHHSPPDSATDVRTQDNVDHDDMHRKSSSFSSLHAQQPPRHDHYNQQDVVIPVLPEGLMTGALTAAASVYNTAKALISTLQPPCDHHSPGDVRGQPNLGPPGPMSLLIEMGFHDRELNQRLLTEKGGCLEDVIAELIRLRPDRSLNID